MRPAPPEPVRPKTLEVVPSPGQVLRIPTGVKGLDRVIGGFPCARSVLLIGDSGSGKTVFSLQFARYCGRQGTRTAFLTTAEDAGDLREQGRSFGWDLEELERRGRLTFVELGPARTGETEMSLGMGIDARGQNFAELLRHLPAGCSVLVVDDLGGWAARLGADEFRDRLDLFVHSLRKKGVTALLVLDSATSGRYRDLALFSTFGALRLLRRENPYTGRQERMLDIIKMRGVPTPVHFLPFEINSGGLEVICTEERPAAARLQRQLRFDDRF